MGKVAIRVEDLSKKYSIGSGRAASFRETFSNMWNRSPDTREFWALRNVSFEVEKGEAVGIIGRNGAGKSTLLKILSQITTPTSGKAEIYGRVSSLLEVGTGFHPELTGRENVYLNGTILGMRRSEVKSKFDEIVAFSGVEKFIDTPIKHYSSGMKVRLAFAVAAHLKTEILIIDEVLAVGDYEFQKKCLGKMEEVTGEGRTVLFVSHNLSALKNFCTRGLLLQTGSLRGDDTISKIIDQYSMDYLVHGEKTINTIFYFHPWVEVKMMLINGTDLNKIVLRGRCIEVSLELEFQKVMPFEMDVHLKKDGQFLASYANFVKNDVTTFQVGNYRLNYRILLPDLRTGTYTLDFYFTDPFVCWTALIEDKVYLEIENSETHHHIDSATIKWGAVVLEGTQSFSKKK